jgi:ABC-type dipeptide/oligopeptide/nickel transport system ATPase subunit
MERTIGDSAMKAQQATNLVDILLKRYNYPLLTDVERQILSHSWNDLTYALIAEHLGYSSHYTRNLARQLWKRLSLLFQQPVTKDKIHKVLSSYDLIFYPPPTYSNRKIALPDYYQPHPQEEKLTQAIIHNYFQVMGIFGVLGTGKSTLARAIVEQVYCDFNVVIWHSFQEEPLSFSQWVKKIRFLLGKPPHSCPQTIQEQIVELVHLLRNQRCLLVLDQFEQLFTPRTTAGEYDWNNQAYRDLIQCLATENHKSYLILTSREYPQDYQQALKTQPLFKSIQLQGLTGLQAKQLLKDLGMSEKDELFDQLQHQFDHNPWALIQAFSYIQRSNSRDAIQFLEPDLMFPEIWQAYSQQIKRLSNLERTIIWSLREAPKCFPKDQLLTWQSHLSKLEIKQGLESLQARSLLKVDSGFIIVSSLLQSYLRKVREQETDRIKELAHSFLCYASSNYTREI